MITIDQVVWTFLFLLGAAFVFALLWYLVVYLQGEFGTAPPLLWKACRILLVVGMVLVLIGVILDLMGHPVVAWRTVR